MTIEHRQEEINTLHADVFDDPNVEREKANVPGTLSESLDDAAVLERARLGRNGVKFTRLWAGEVTGYPSHSEADLALASILWFWIGDRQRVDAFFRRSGLYRSKWDQRHYSDGTTYGAGVLDCACRGESYSPSRRSAKLQGLETALGPPKALADAALYGLAGEVVEAIRLHTEADDAALLMTFLAYVGNAIGRAPHGRAEADRHGVNLFTVIVGDTSKGRKGSSRGHIHELLGLVDPVWTGTRIAGGMVSGEGLVWFVRDPVEKRVPVKDDKRPTGELESVIVDAGVDDKRLLAYEPEFASVLKVMLRETNTLSTQIRQAWDSGNMRTMAKNTPAHATEAHVSILGHVTKQELLRYLTEIEAANGFGNRFLWVWTKRARVLPEGGGEADYRAIVPRLHTAIERAHSLDRIERDTEAKAIWADVYPDLSVGKPGLFGAITARAEAQVFRLSVLYAVLDGSNRIRKDHLMAALAVWDFCEQSARYIFGDATGDAFTDRILAAVRQSREMTRTEIQTLLGRNMPERRIEQARDVLVSARLITVEFRKTGGRPTEVWITDC